MKKWLPLLLLAVLIIVTVGLMKLRFGGGGMFMSKQLIGGDLVIINDSSETFSSAFMRNGKMMSQVIKPNEKATGGKGLIRVFVANKSGNYEIQYPYPRPAGKPAEISLTQVLRAVHNPELGPELMTEKGKIDDIRVNYEQVRDLGEPIY